MLNNTCQERLVMELDGHRVRPIPSGFNKEKKSAIADFFSLLNPDQLMAVRHRHELK
ncbi:MAG: hypothetical protein AAGG68_01485 [Bacteroidota bacterium]